MQKIFAARNVGILAISTDTATQGKALKAKLGLDFPLYSDPLRKVITAWKVADSKRDIALPATFGIAKGGAVVFRHVGKNPADRPAHRAAFEALIGR